MKIFGYNIVKNEKIDTLVTDNEKLVAENTKLKKGIESLKSELATVLKLWDLEMQQTRMNKNR